MSDTSYRYLNYLHSLLQKLQAKEAKSEDDIFHISEEFAEMQQQNEHMATELKVLS